MDDSFRGDCWGENWKRTPSLYHGLHLRASIKMSVWSKKKRLEQFPVVEPRMRPNKRATGRFRPSLRSRGWGGVVRPEEPVPPVTFAGAEAVGRDGGPFRTGRASEVGDPREAEPTREPESETGHGELLAVVGKVGDSGQRKRIRYSTVIVKPRRMEKAAAEKVLSGSRFGVASVVA